MKLKKLVGERTTFDEIEKALGKEESWAATLERVTIRDETRRKQLRFHQHDASKIHLHPPYVVHSLNHCARRVLEAPRAVFKGLRQNNSKSGYAFCGRPSWMYDNDGNRCPPPQGMIYVVYSNSDDFVFDWDWVKADPAHPDYPTNWQDRFLELSEPVACTLEGIPADTKSAFNPEVAVYSEKGDCVFTYASDALAYADRASDDLTVFRELGTDYPVGCKLKNIESILESLPAGGVFETSSPKLDVVIVLSTWYHRQIQNGRRTNGYADVVQALEKNQVSPIFPYPIGPALRAQLDDSSHLR